MSFRGCKTSLFRLRTSNVWKCILLVFRRKIHYTVWCAALTSPGWLPYRCYKLPPSCYELPRAGAVRNRCKGFNLALLFTFQRTCGRLRVFSSIDNETGYRSSTKTQPRDDKHEYEFKIPNSVTNCPTLPYVPKRCSNLDKHFTGHFCMDSLVQFWRLKRAKFHDLLNAKDRLWKYWTVRTETSCAQCRSVGFVVFCSKHSAPHNHDYIHRPGVKLFL